MKMSKVWFVVFGGVVLVSAVASAQVRVVGPPPEPKVEWLRSPMVLEAPMPVAEVSEARGGWSAIATTHDFTGFAVNGVRLDVLSFEIDARRDGCEIDVVTQVIVEPGHDKDVVLSFEVLRGEETVWTYSTREWGVDSGSTAQRTWTASPRVASARCRELAEGDGLLLHVTYRVANDV
jgi:hypothetical protein